MLHVINPRLSCINITVYSFLSWTSLFVELFFSSPFFPVSSKCQAFWRSLCAAGASTSQDSAQQTTGSALLSPSIPHPPNTQKMSTQGKAFLPCHPPIYPSTHPSNPLIRADFQEHRPETDDPMTSCQPLPLCLSLPLPLALPPTEPF